MSRACVPLTAVAASVVIVLGLGVVGAAIVVLGLPAWLLLAAWPLLGVVYLFVLTILAAGPAQPALPDEPTPQEREIPRRGRFARDRDSQARTRERVAD